MEPKRITLGKLMIGLVWSVMDLQAGNRLRYALPVTARVED